MISKRLVTILENYSGRIAGVAAVLVLLLGSVRFFVVSPGRVNGPSMEPNYMDEQLFFVDKLTLLIRPPRRYEVVQLVDPQAHKFIIKRIVGLPGETVIMRRGKLFIQKTQTDTEEELTEPYLAPDTYTTTLGQLAPIHYSIPPDHYFVVGDHRAQSVDSRVYGPVGRGVIVGRVIW